MDHRNGDFTASCKPRIHADAGSARFDELQKFARAGQKSIGRVFGIDAAFDGVSMLVEVTLGEGEFLSRRDANLPVDKVNACDEFGDGMFHLQAGVHFKKEERAERMGSKMNSMVPAL
jgi:hypothetical protein